MERSPDPTQITPVAERKLALNRKLAEALPDAPREEIEVIQAQVQTVSPEGVDAAVEQIKSSRTRAPSDEQGARAASSG